MGLTNDHIVRNALRTLVHDLRHDFPSVKFAVNASAPGLNRDLWTGGHIRNLVGIFDEYVTEWNPYRWGQSASVIAQAIRSTGKEVSNGKITHAFTATTRHGDLLSQDQLQSLFEVILSNGASPWLSVHFGQKYLEQIYSAYLSGREKTHKVG